MQKLLTFFQQKYLWISVLTRTVNILTTNELVKLTMLWTAGPSTFQLKKKLYLGLWFFSLVSHGQFLWGRSRWWWWSCSIHVRSRSRAICPRSGSAKFSRCRSTSTRPLVCCPRSQYTVSETIQTSFQVNSARMWHKVHGGLEGVFDDYFGVLSSAHT